MIENDFPQKFLFALKLTKRAENSAQNRVFLSFHKILSLLFAKSNLK